MKRNKKIVLVVLPIMAVLIACAALFIPWNVERVVTVETGIREIPLEQFATNGKPVTLVTDASGIDLSKPGEYVLELAQDNRTFQGTLKITDTTPPIGAPVIHTIYNDETLRPEDFVTDIRDATEVTVTFEKTPDFTVAGEQAVVLLLTDTTGNVGKVTAKLTVLADTTAPVFSPMEELVVNLGQTVSYRKDIVATDDRDGQLQFTIDSSQVNLEQEGTYPITYTATDSSGNTTQVERTIKVSASLVINQELVEEKAREVLAEILKEDMTSHEKIEQIYNYVRRHVRYSSSSETDILNAAYKAMVKGRGDCYNYFALAKVLLDLCDIDNLPVERYKAKSSHYWLLVNVGTGWYHFDASPQSPADPFRCFMKTDAQVKAYAKGRSDGRSDYYQFDKTLYPDRATEKYKAP